VDLAPDVSDDDSTDYEVSENFAEDLIRFCRSRHVGDERQALIN